MKFSKLATVYEQLEKISSGNKIREVLAQFFKKIPKKDISHVIYFTVGQIDNQYSDVNLGMAERMVVKSVAVASGVAEKEVRALQKKLGDIGRTAEQTISKGKGGVDSKKIYDVLHKIATTTGAGSQEKKISLLAELFRKTTPVELRYLARLVLGQLRLGVGDKAVLDALAIAFAGGKEARKDLEAAYNTCPDVAEIAQTLVGKGMSGVRKIGVKVGRPIQMMLCQRIKQMSGIEDKAGFPIGVEQKYDGERVQIHKTGKKVVLFSRRMEDITSQFPDVVQIVLKNINAKSCVVEAEIMALGKKGKLLHFQTLMQRRRKHDVEKYVKKIPVAVFMFEALYVNGRSLIGKSYPKRYSELKKIAKPKIMAKRITCKDVDCVQSFFKKIISEGGEGIVIKSFKKDSVYRAGVRGWSWIKWKPEYEKGMRDTFDLVVVGGYYGKGRRAGTYGGLLLAAYNKRKDKFETVTKLGSGFTDKQLAQLPKMFRVVKKKPARLDCAKAMEPDVWLAPAKVVETIASEITRSPNHTCGKKEGRGLALRFPRFLKFREKKPEQATSSDEIKRMAK